MAFNITTWSWHINKGKVLKLTSIVINDRMNLPWKQRLAGSSLNLRSFLASVVFSTACHHCDWVAKWKWLLAPSLEVGPIKLCTLSSQQCLPAQFWAAKVPSPISSSLTSFASQPGPSTIPSFLNGPGSSFPHVTILSQFTQPKRFGAEGNKYLFQRFMTLMLLL